MSATENHRRTDSREGKSDQPRRHVWPGWLRAIWRFLRFLWREAVPLLAVFSVLYVVLNVESKVDRQREGRAVAVDVSCGSLNGVAEAVRGVFAASLKATTSTPQARRYQHNLEKLGAPTVAQRRVLSEQAQNAFAATISRNVLEEAGVDAAETIVLPNGSLDCKQLRIAIGAPDPDR